jgi:hypothetical protein
MERMPLYLTRSNGKLRVRTESLINDFPQVWLSTSFSYSHNLVHKTL